MQAVGRAALQALWGRCASSHGYASNLGVLPWAGMDGKSFLSLEVTPQLFHQPALSNGYGGRTSGAAVWECTSRPSATPLICTDHPAWFRICMWMMKSIPCPRLPKSRSAARYMPERCMGLQAQPGILLPSQPGPPLISVNVLRFREGTVELFLGCKTYFPQLLKKNGLQTWAGQHQPPFHSYSQRSLVTAKANYWTLWKNTFYLSAERTVIL